VSQTGSGAWYRKLHAQIAAGLVLGAAFGVAATFLGWQQFTADWIGPLGVLFLNLLKLVAVPLVVTTLVAGVASLPDLRSLSRIGTRAVGLFLATTIIACLIALGLATAVRPGARMPAEMAQGLGAGDQAVVERGIVEEALGRSPLAPLVEIVPENVLAAASDNRNLLQVVFLSLLIGAALVRVAEEHSRPVVQLFEALAHVTVALVNWIMKAAPLGVFALMAGAITGMAVDGPGELLTLFAVLGQYAAVLVLALLIQTFGVYGLLIQLFSEMSPRRFFSGISAAQLVGFSTSSSAATLPVTMERCTNELDVPEEITSFVVPLGATVHMNGTAIFLCVASLFLVQATGTPLSGSGYLTILVLATLGSIGAVAIPSIGIVFLIVILETLGVATAGVALILGVDRVLDMARTVTNVTGDAVVAVMIAAFEKQKP
jgi:proton glutamate symport protein